MKYRLFTLFLMMSCLCATISFSQKLFKVDRTKSAKTTTAAASKPKSSVSQKPRTATKQKSRGGGVSNAPTLGTSNYTPEVKTYYANGVAFQMVEVRGGTFRMGATSEQGSDANNDEKPTHQVTLSSYYIGKTEVTQALWKAVMSTNPSNFKGGNLPVERVSWNDCQTFIIGLNVLTGKNFRLPTEAEWEYAARGGNNSRGYMYSGSNSIIDVAWHDLISGKNTHSVGTNAPNELGIYDMSGNVWEWCNDWYGSYSSASQTNPKGPNSGADRVSRGGSLYDNARCCRVSIRNFDTPEDSFWNLGLRLALSE